MTLEAEPLADLNALRETLCAELPVSLLYEHDERDYPAFELDILPHIEESLTRLRRLDAARLIANPHTTYLFAVHALEVATDLEALAHRVGAPEHVATSLYYLGLVHDVGKLLLPAGVWETSSEKPYGPFKALRRTHSALGAAFLSANTGFLNSPHIEECVLPVLMGQTHLSSIVPHDIVQKVPETIDFAKLEEAIQSSPFKASQSAFIPLAVTACLRHHEKTGRDAPADQPLWLKLLALLEDLSGNMVERPHFAAAGRKTSLEDAVNHMLEEGQNTHDLLLLNLIAKTKTGEWGTPPRRDMPPWPG